MKFGWWLLSVKRICQAGPHARLPKVAQKKKKKKKKRPKNPKKRPEHHGGPENILQILRGVFFL
jgi:hypothetical protein